MFKSSFPNGSTCGAVEFVDLGWLGWVGGYHSEAGFGDAGQLGRPSSDENEYDREWRWNRRLHEELHEER